MQQLLDAGEIVSTHGVRGELKLLPWTDSPEFLLDFPRLSIDGRWYDVERSRVQKTCLLVKLRGVDSAEDVARLVKKIAKIDRDDVPLPEGAHYIADLIGCEAVDEEGNAVGTLTDVLQHGSVDTWVFKTVSGTLMAPALLAVFPQVDAAARRILVVAEKLREVAVYDR